jgi:hypothetical protein
MQTLTREAQMSAWGLNVKRIVLLVFEPGTDGSICGVLATEKQWHQ